MSVTGSCASYDGFVKAPSAALRCILRHCGVLKSTPHSSGFARLADEAFTKPSVVMVYYGGVLYEGAS